ncbi:LRC14 protein, partial [Rhabdornis inornatus]|nr:LRC14 protein [Rhabdornis inornatus]
EDCIDCVQAVIQAVVAQLQQEMEEPSLDSSLRMLDMTGLLAGISIWSITVDLAKACVEVSKHQEEFQRRGPKRHKGCSGAAMA